MRLTFAFRQLPLALLLVLLFKAGSVLGIYAKPVWGLWILVTGYLVLMWPVGMFRLGRVALDSARLAEGRLRRQLQGLWLFSLLYSCLVLVLGMALTGTMVWLTCLYD